MSENQEEKLDVQEAKFREEFTHFYEVVSTQFAALLQMIENKMPELDEKVIWREALTIFMSNTRAKVTEKFGRSIKSSCRQCYGTGVTHMEDSPLGIPYPSICKCVKHSLNMPNHIVITELYKKEEEPDAAKTSEAMA